MIAWGKADRRSPCRSPAQVIVVRQEIGLPWADVQAETRHVGRSHRHGFTRRGNVHAVGDTVVRPTFEHVFLGVVHDDLRHALAAAFAHRVAAPLEFLDRIRREAELLVVDHAG